VRADVQARRPDILREMPRSGKFRAARRHVFMTRQLVPEGRDR
jgi:hypothetical protein